MQQEHSMRRTTSGRALIAVLTLLLGACAQQQVLVMRPPPPQLIMRPDVDVVETEPDEADPMADVKGDQKLPALAGAVERIDCKVGDEDLQARMALEARGGQVVNFAYYSKWRPRTCSLDMQRDAAFTKWRRTADGATRVQTPHGSFLIRVRADAYEFEFLDVERQRFCGMDGHTNGKMIILRNTAAPQCAVAGLLDRDDLEPDVALVQAPAGEAPAPGAAQVACMGAIELCGRPAFYPAAATP